MTHRIDPAEDDVQLPAAEPVVDRGEAEAEVEQLAARHGAALTRASPPHVPSSASGEPMTASR
jgi:hypothetical protein